jgi:uncharacterized protein (TIGR03437 family)
MRKWILAALGAAMVYGQEAPMAIYSGGPARAQAAVRTAPPGMRMSQARPGVFALPPLTPRERAERSPRQIGISRALSAGALRPATVITLPDGRRLWRAALSSPGAVGLRLHFSAFHAGEGTVWAYGADQSFEGPFTGDGAFGDGDFWTGIVPGSQVTIEFLEAAPNSAPRLPPFEVDAIGHLWSDGLTAAAGEGPRNVAACHLDVSCYPAYQSAAKGVVLIFIREDSGALTVCSASMVNTRTTSFRPYLLTANHCVASASEARTVIAVFFYQTASCNGTAPSLGSLPAVVGATYLAGAAYAGADYSLLLLNSNAPQGATFLGWRVEDPSFTETLAGIHHPDGSWKRISFGRRTEDAPTFLTDGTELPADRYYKLTWTSGLIEGGSSGSPLLNSAGQILGTLTSGSSGTDLCAIDPFRSTYGRFSNAYTAIGRYLDETLPALTANPSSLTFTVNNGQYTGPSQQAFSLLTTSESALPYSLSASAPWIRLSRASGSVSAAAPASITVSIDHTAFTASANAVGTITASSGGLLPATVTVRANVTVPETRPFVTSVGSGASFEPPISPGQWVAIRGTNLAPSTRTLDFVDGAYPTSADGVSVTVNNRPAYLQYLSPGQLNVIAPDSIGTPVEVVVRTPGGTSSPLLVFSQPAAPAMFLWPLGQPVATDLSFGYIARPGTFPGISSRSARPEEILVLWATGLGPTDPPVAAGAQVPADRIYRVAGSVEVTIGGLPAEVIGAALAPGLASLYQIAVRVPRLASGDQSVVIRVNGVASPGAILSVGE